MFTDADKTEYKSTYQFLKDISEIYNDLTDKNQAALLETIGGKRGAQSLAGILADFSEVERAMDEMKGAAGAADKEMEVIQDSIDYKLNALKQTWIGTLQDVTNRDTFKDTLDGLTSISEGLGGIISKLGLVKTAVLGIGGVITSQKLGLLKYITKGDKSGINNAIDSIVQMSQTGKSIVEAKTASKALSGLTNITSGSASISNLQEYRNILSGLSDEQKALALSTSQLNEQQARMILTYSQAGYAETALSEAEANRVLAQAGLISSTKALTQEELSSLATKTGLTEVQLTQAMQQAGAIVTKQGDVLVTKELNEAELEQSLISAGVAESNAAETASYIAETAAKGAATAATTKFAGGTNLLIGALSSLKGVLVAHPVIAVLAAITAAVALFIRHEKKHKEEIQKIAEETVESYNNSIKRLKDGKKDFDELSKEYVELSKGVNSVGDNVSLTTDEYERYHEVANNLAEITPSLVKAWDDQGNAILRVRDDVLALSDAYKQELRDANNLIISKSADLVENSSIELEEGEVYNKPPQYLEDTKELLKQEVFTIKDLEKERAEVNDLFSMLEKAGVDTSTIDLSDDTEILNFLNNELDNYRDLLNDYISKQEDLYSVQKRLDNAKELLKNEVFTSKDIEPFRERIIDSNGELVDDYTNLFTMLQSAEIDTKGLDWRDENSVLNFLNNMSEKDRSAFEAYITNTEATLSAALSDRKKLFKAYLQNGLLDSDLSSDLQNILYSLSDTIDNSILESLDTDDKIFNYVQTILDAFQNLSAEDQNQVNEYINISTLWNNDELSYDEYVEKIQAFSELLAELFPEDEEIQKSIKVLFDIPTEEELSKQQDIFVNRLGEKKAFSFGNTDEYQGSMAGMPSNVINKMKSQGTEVAQSWYDSLTLSEREFVDNLSDTDLAEAVEFNSTEQFDEWLEKIKSEKIELEPEIKSTDAVKSLNDLESDWSGLDTVYQSTVNTPGGTAEAKDIESVNTNMGGIKDESGEYTSMANALEAYNDALVENKGDSKAAQEATDKLATAYIDQSGILDNLQESNADYYIEMLKARGVTNAEEVVMTRLSETAKNSAKAMTELSKSIAKYRDQLDNGSLFDNAFNGDTDAQNAISTIKGQLQDMLTMYDESGNAIAVPELDTTFIKQNLADIEAAVEGDIDAVDRLRIAAARASASKISIGVNIPTEAAEQQLDRMMEQVMNVDAMDIEVGASVDDGPFIATLANMIHAGQTTADQVAAAFESMGYTVEWKPHPYTATLVDTFKEHGNHGMQASDIAAMAKQVQIQMDVPELTIKRSSARSGARTNFGGTPSGGSNNGGGNTNGGSDSDSSANESEETFDWVEVAIQRVEDQINHLDEAVENVYSMWTNRNKNLRDEIAKTEKELELQATAEDIYLAKAKDVGLDKAYRTKVEQGEAIDINSIETVNKEELINKINEYKQWWEKYRQAQYAQQTLEIKLGEQYKKRFDQFKEEYEEQINLVQSYADLIDKRLNRVEEKGYFASKEYYKELQNLESQNIKTQKAELDKLIKARDEAVASGRIKYGSQAWHEMTQEILGVASAIEESTTNLVKWDKQMRQIDWDVFDFMEERIDQINQEADFLIDLLDNQKMYKDSGMFNQRGWGAVEMRAVKYDTYMQQSRDYAKERAKIEKELAKDPADKELIKHREELIKLQQESIKNAYAEKEAVKDLVQEGKYLLSINLFNCWETLKTIIPQRKDEICLGVMV